MDALLVPWVVLVITGFIISSLCSRIRARIHYNYEFDRGARRCAIRYQLSQIQASTLSSPCSSRLKLFASLRIVRFISSYYNLCNMIEGE
ncbi:hypothetical protein IMY05_002G0005700 [Salix suchowensis]|nr:hypothetical protein IMY05_002G0005700 [Salix suchowensis]